MYLAFSAGGELIHLVSALGLNESGGSHLKPTWLAGQFSERDIVREDMKMETSCGYVTDDSTREAELGASLYQTLRMRGNGGDCSLGDSPVHGELLCQ